MGRHIRFNAFDMNCVGHQSPGLWKHPRDKSWKYKDLDYWQDLARTLERGIFDGIFVADVIGYYDVYKGSNYHAIEQAAQIPVNDPLQLAAPIALATEHLGIGITASTSFEHPYTFARRLSTADHHTKGRVGWNIVTSYLESGAKNVGQTGLKSHDNRYEVASEYVEVLYETAAAVAARQRSYSNGAGPRSSQDPQVLQVVGRIRSNAYAAGAIVLQVAQAIERAYQAHFAGDADAEERANAVAELETSQAVTVVTNLVLEASTIIFDALGASSTRKPIGLDRHWRNARTLSSHNPRIYMDRIVGDFAVNGTPPPYQWQIGRSPSPAPVAPVIEAAAE